MAVVFLFWFFFSFTPISYNLVSYSSIKDTITNKRKHKIPDRIINKVITFEHLFTFNNSLSI